MALEVDVPARLTRPNHTTPNQAAVPSRQNFDIEPHPASSHPIHDTPARLRPRCLPSPPAPVRSHAHGQLTNCPSSGPVAPPYRPAAPRHPRLTAPSRATPIRPRSPRLQRIGTREARRGRRCFSTLWWAQWVRCLRLARRRLYRVRTAL